jgi:membrane fusion protein (multidrug efflux system)
MEQSITSPRRKRRWLLLPAVLVLVVALLLILKPWARSSNASETAAGAADSSEAVASADTTLSPEEESDEDGEDKVPPVPVETVSVERDTVASTYTASATLEAERHVELLGKVNATVEQIRVEEGDDVAKGAVLAVLDDRELKIQVQRFESLTTNAEAEFERVQALMDRDLASQKQLEDARRALDEAKASLEDARLRLSYTKIQAPFSGRVTRRMIEVGQTVTPGMPVFSIADMSPLLVRVFLPEDEIVHIRTGQSVQVRLDADPDLKLSGRVRQVAPLVDRQTGTVKVTVEVAEQSSQVRPGSFVRVFITTDVHPMALVLPKRCLVEETGKRYVFVVQDDTVVVRDVELGYEEADRYEVIEGLEMGDRVVMVGQGSLKEGSKVKILGEGDEEETEEATEGTTS